MESWNQEDWGAEAEVARNSAGAEYRSGQGLAMYDEIIEDGIRKEREQYIESIKDRICSLASAHHGGDDCEFLQDFKRGSYNVCFFVRFFRRPRPARELDAAPNGDRWVVRCKPHYDTRAQGPCIQHLQGAGRARSRLLYDPRIRSRQNVGRAWGRL
ncbi:hypothetical protein GGTG_04575 [Gaeumannomyces tritici R3-111a-1]|uniref:Uncharacterized protein n=1 Tax=Gaeumannomyces tritici (strain R3-111a-1) TaxID=644352 RepID=J3NTH6_GAET3|nr:hypothetical protein GGTG_04575 [Gaeumannomyces tritici R3-111a-1]EJT79491.1 hypothetical protein GGTG_04575 [Gaeumannomyces tritici R3-111a-1]